MATYTDLRQNLNRLINECLAELRKDRTQLEEHLFEIGMCLDQNNEWHAMLTKDGRICAGKIREQSLCIIDPGIEQIDKQIEQITIEETIPLNRERIPPDDKEGFIEIVEKKRNLFEKR